MGGEPGAATGLAVRAVPARADAAVPVVQLPPPAPITAATVTAPDPRELTRSLQTELKRVGCFLGEVNGDFDDATLNEARQLPSHHEEVFGTNFAEQGC